MILVWDWKSEIEMVLGFRNKIAIRNPILTSLFLLFTSRASTSHERRKPFVEDENEAKLQNLS